MTAAFFFHPQGVGLALTRIAFPFSNRQWPRNHHLVLQPLPAIVTKGTNIVFSLADRNDNLPDSAELQIRRVPRVSGKAQRLHMSLTGDRFLFQLDDIRRTIEYRAVGGDDDSMPWRRMDVVDAPRVESLTIHATPPRYAGADSYRWSAPTPVLAGTLIEVAGVVDEPIDSAELCFFGGDRETVIPLQVDDDQRTIRSDHNSDRAMLVERSGIMGFRLKTLRGLHAEHIDEITIAVKEDVPPVVQLKPDVAHRFVTPRAILPLSLKVEDDLRIERIDLQYGQTHQLPASIASLSLHDSRRGLSHSGMIVADRTVDRRGPDASIDGAVGDYQKVPPPSEKTVHAMTDLELPQPDVRKVDVEWALDDTPEMAPGTAVSFRGSALDSGQQEGTSRWLELSVISEAEFNKFVQRRVSALRDRLSWLVERQTQLAEDVRTIADLPRSDEKSAAAFSQRLDLTQRTQQELKQDLASPSMSARVEIEGLLLDLSINRSRQQQLIEHLMKSAHRCSDLAQNDLEEVDRLLASLEESWRDSGHAARLSEVQSLQTNVAKSLDEMVHRLRRWDDVRQAMANLKATRRSEDQSVLERFGQQLESLARQQRDVLERTESFDRSRHRGEKLDEASTEMLTGLADEERDIARGLESAQVEGQAGHDLTTAIDPLLADLNEAARRLGNHESGQETQQRQRSALAGLSELSRTLRESSDAHAEDGLLGRSDGQRTANQGLPGKVTVSSGKPLPVVVRDLLEKTWGHLPARERAAIQAANQLEFLPAHRQLIEDYFRRLNDETD